MEGISIVPQESLPGVAERAIETMQAVQEVAEQSHEFEVTPAVGESLDAAATEVAVEQVQLEPEMESAPVVDVTPDLDPEPRVAPEPDLDPRPRVAPEPDLAPVAEVVDMDPGTENEF